MTVQAERACTNLAESGYDLEAAAAAVWQTFQEVGVIQMGDFTFAGGTTSEVKVDAEIIYGYPAQFKRMLGLCATFPCIQEADLILDPPNGWRKFADALKIILGDGVEVVHPQQVEGGARTDYYLTDEQLEIVLAAKKIAIVDDVATELTSAFGVRKVLPTGSDVHLLTLLRRDRPRPEHLQGIVPHYLVERYIPRTRAEYLRRLETDDWSFPE